MSNEKKIPLIGIIGAINNGIPLVKDFIGLFKKTKKSTDGLLNGMSQQQLIEHIKQIESRDDKPFIVRFSYFALTCATVYFVVYISKEFGISRQDIIELFGLINF